MSAWSQPRRHRECERFALEPIERMVTHIRNETMGRPPLLEDLLDEATDRELALAYSITR